MKHLAELHSRVSGAIWRAEQAEKQGDGGSAAKAWAEVSSLEADLASAIPVSEPEGRIARRGAVRAALKAGDHQRGESLAEQYMGEEGAPESLLEAIREILSRSRSQRSRAFAIRRGIRIRPTDWNL